MRPPDDDPLISRRVLTILKLIGIPWLVIDVAITAVLLIAFVVML